MAYRHSWGVSATDVDHAMAGLQGATGASHPVIAWDHATCEYWGMVQFTAGAWALGPMEAILAAGMTCRVQGIGYPILRFTHTRSSPHRTGQRPSQVDDLHTAGAGARHHVLPRGATSLELTRLSRAS